MRVSLLGAGWVTAAGRGPSPEAARPVLGPGPLPGLRRRDVLETPHPRFGRFDAYTRVGFAAVALALRDAGLAHWEVKRPLGLVVATERGCLAMDRAYLATTREDGGTLASPNLFAYTLPTCMLGEAAIQFGLTGPALVVDDAPAGHLGGVTTALELLDAGLCETVVAGWCEIPDAGAATDGDVGAVFVVLRRTADARRLHWDGAATLTSDAGPVESLTDLVGQRMQPRDET